MHYANLYPQNDDRIVTIDSETSHHPMHSLYHNLYHVPNFIKIGQTVTEISRFSWFYKMAAAAILDFQKFEILTIDSL